MSEESMKDALEEFLSLYGIKLDPAKDAGQVQVNIQEKIDELNVKGEELLKKTGKTREEIEAFGANPRNFTPEQWEALQKVKKAADDFKRKAYRALPAQALEKKEEGEKPQKHRFGKKKHWIPL